MIPIGLIEMNFQSLVLVKHWDSFGSKKLSRIRYVAILTKLMVELQKPADDETIILMQVSIAFTISLVFVVLLVLN